MIRINVDCNYLQLWEGGVDSSHVGILHSNIARPGWMDESFVRSEDAEIPPISPSRTTRRRSRWKTPTMAFTMQR